MTADIDILATLALALTITAALVAVRIAVRRDEKGWWLIAFFCVMVVARRAVATYRPELRVFEQSLAVFNTSLLLVGLVWLDHVFGEHIRTRDSARVVMEGQLVARGVDVGRFIGGAGGAGGAGGSSAGGHAGEPGKPGEAAVGSTGGRGGAGGRGGSDS